MASRCLALAIVVISGLAGCVPPAADYTESESPKTLRLDPAPARLTVGFVSGSSRIVPRDLESLRWTASSGGFVRSDRVVVAVAGPPTLAAARFDAVSTSLLPYGIVPSPARFAVAPPDAAVILRERYLVSLPACPNWSKPSSGAGDFTNTVSSNFGCASAVNLGMSVATPADLVEGRQVGFSDAHPAAEAVNSYRRNKVQLPTAAALGPIAIPTNQTPAAPGGGADGLVAPP